MYVLCVYLARCVRKNARLEAKHGRKDVEGKASKMGMLERVFSASCAANVFSAQADVLISPYVPYVIDISHIWTDGCFWYLPQNNEMEINNKQQYYYLFQTAKNMTEDLSNAGAVILANISREVENR